MVEHAQCLQISRRKKHKYKPLTQAVLFPGLPTVQLAYNYHNLFLCVCISFVEAVKQLTVKALERGLIECMMAARTEENAACLRVYICQFCLPKVLLQLDIFFHHPGALADLRTAASVLSPFAARPGGRGCT